MSAETEREWTIEKLAEEQWRLSLLVDSTLDDSFQWEWKADISVESDRNGSFFHMASTEYTSRNMAESDRPTNFTLHRQFTAGISRFSSKDWGEAVEGWAAECRRLSGTLDQGVLSNRRLREDADANRAKSEEERQALRDFFDSQSQT